MRRCVFLVVVIEKAKRWNGTERNGKRKCEASARDRKRKEEKTMVKTERGRTKGM